MNKSLLLIPFALAASIGGLALAQSAGDELDLDAIRARAAQHAADAEALATSVRERADALTEEARATQSNAQTNRSTYVQSVGAGDSAAALDFDGMVRAQAEAERASIGTSPRFIAFASLSMPPAALKALVHDMALAGGVTVLRGFPDGNSENFKRRLAAIWSDGSDTGSLGIDPRLFRAFAIKSAPSFVMIASDFSPCDGFDCTSAVPPHDRIAGNVSVAHVLETFAGGNGPGAALARMHLSRLEEPRP